MKVQELIDACAVLNSYERYVWQRVKEKAKSLGINTRYYDRKGGYTFCKDYIEFELHDGEAPGYRDYTIVQLTHREIEMSDEDFYEYLNDSEQQRREKEEKEKALQEMAARAIRKQQYEKLKLEFEPKN